jgi:xanthine dehydrogenase YagT iron-sulfur-binding subunit
MRETHGPSLDEALDIQLADPRGRRLTLREVRGRPVIAVLAPGLPFDASDEDFLRAELRGLGAALLVITPQSAWLVGADDPMVEVEAVHEAHAPSRLFTLLVTLLGVDPGRTTIVIQGDDGTIRWRHETGDLVDALARAATIRRTAPALRVSRREVLVSALVGAVAAAVMPRLAHARAPDGAAPTTPAQAGSVTTRVVLEVNGHKESLDIEPRVSLLDALRETLGLTGSKKGCDHGQCGACTVLVDGRRTLSCLSLAVMHDGAKVTTIEGLALGDKLHPVQAAFLEHDAFQCGYCTPGQIMSAVGCLSEGRARTANEIREAMSGNICRCGAYPNIVAAIAAVRNS